ncbi:hypothetical protein AB1Y20_001542 [Prymnesium parvum]|uniref:Uncharacterized protein n=1 Tax=Prymnesium parvum TaxID=97485 RepID=A0AB34KBP0_PRYPA
MRVLNCAIFLAFIVNTVLTFLSNTGAYGHTNSELSKKYQTLATPAGWAFSIWGVIFSLQGIYAVAQLLPSFRDADEVTRAGPWFAAACIFQAAWSVTFGHECIVAAQVLILSILVSLWRTNFVLNTVAKATPPTFGRYFLLYLPFSIHFGWLTAASVVSTNLTLVAYAPSAHVTLLAVAIASLTVVFLPAFSGSDSAYALTVAWALTAVFAQLQSPKDDAPAADPIKSWCPPLVTESLSIVALTLAFAVIASVLVRQGQKIWSHARSPADVKLSDLLMTA